ncbi:hypothetical protein HanIR_Chr16g0804351 [Helianthus annuus]|nr:hypothetical protein HanIR_Chr16g0804351 [Helianthus annuus]
MQAKGLKFKSVLIHKKFLFISCSSLHKIRIIFISYFVSSVITHSSYSRSLVRIPVCCSSFRVCVDLLL